MRASVQGLLIVAAPPCGKILVTPEIALALGSLRIQGIAVTAVYGDPEVPRWFAVGDGDEIIRLSVNLHHRHLANAIDGEQDTGHGGDCPHHVSALTAQRMGHAAAA